MSNLCIFVIWHLMQETLSDFFLGYNSVNCMW